MTVVHTAMGFSPSRLSFHVHNLESCMNPVHCMLIHLILCFIYFFFNILCLLIKVSLYRFNGVCDVLRWFKSGVGLSLFIDAQVVVLS